MTDFKAILDNTRNIKNTTKDDYFHEKSKGIITSVIVGAGLGLMVAYNHKGNLVLGSVLGGITAGVIFNYFINKE